LAFGSGQFYLALNDMAQPQRQDNLAIFAYGSLLSDPARNAIRYLAQNIQQGIVTPLTYAYRDAILRLTGVVDLTQAEEIVLRSGRTCFSSSNS
jgi:hypothetical protein